MRDYGKVHTSIWESLSFRGMSEDGRTIAMYLLTCPHGTIAGVFRLPDGYACEDLQWDSERVKKGFQELLEKGFANRCETTKWVWIFKHFDWNKLENPNQRKAAQRIAAQIPDGCGWKLDFMRVCGSFFGMDATQDDNPSETLREPFLNQEQEQEQKQKKEQNIKNPPNPPVGGDGPGPGKPKRERKPRIQLKTFIDLCKQSDEKPISGYRPLLEYVERTGLPMEFVQLAWEVFKGEFLGDGAKAARLQSDWRRHFKNYVEKGYYRLWWAKHDGTYELTTAGVQAKAFAQHKEAA